jgi:hypothetical protein
MSPAAVVQRCAGSGKQAVSRGRIFGECPACGERLTIIDDDGTLWTHRVELAAEPDPFPPRFHLFRRSHK